MNNMLAVKTKEDYEREGREFTQDLLSRHEGWTDEQWQEKYGHMWESMKKQDTYLRLPIEEQARLHQEQLTAYEESKTALAKIKTYAEMADVQKRFINMLGEREGRAFIESVIIAVSNNANLQSCTPKSIMISAMRAASLRLSVDPALRQGHLVAYGNECTFIPDYHGLVQMSINTNYYEKAPHVGEVFEGETVKTNRLTGEVEVLGEKTSDKIIGWLAYYKAKNGTERWLYMTNEECDAHGQKYNPRGFESKRSAWTTDREKMRRKTVLRQLVSRWGHFSPHVQRVIMQDEPAIDAEIEDMPDDKNIIVPEQKKSTRSQDELIAELTGGS